MLASRSASWNGRPSATSAARLRDQHEAVLHGDAEQADQADQRRHVPGLAGDQQRDDAADERVGQRGQDDQRLGERAEREVEQHEHREQRRRAMASVSDARRARLALDPAADVDEVAGRQLELRAPAARGPRRAALPRSRPATLASTAIRRLPASRRIAPGPKRLLDRARAGRAGCACRRGRRSAALRIARDVAARRSSCSRTTRSKRRWPTQTSRDLLADQPDAHARG